MNLILCPTGWNGLFYGGNNRLAILIDQNSQSSSYPQIMGTQQVIHAGFCINKDFSYVHNTLGVDFYKTIFRHTIASFLIPSACEQKNTTIRPCCEQIFLDSTNRS